MSKFIEQEAPKTDKKDVLENNDYQSLYLSFIQKEIPTIVKEPTPEPPVMRIQH
jgi:hypothetical protein